MSSDKFASALNANISAQHFSMLSAAKCKKHRQFTSVYPASRSLRCHAPKQWTRIAGLKTYVETQLCSSISFHDEYQVTDQSIHPIVREGRRVSTLHRKLLALKTVEEKVAFLSKMKLVKDFLDNSENYTVKEVMQRLPAQDKYLLLCLPATGQSHVLKIKKEGNSSYLQVALHKLLNTLRRVEVFYDSIGGVIGYQAKSLHLIAAGMEELKEEQQAKKQGTAPCKEDLFAMSERLFHVPKAVDLAAEDGREVARVAAQAGLRSMPLMAEIYPVGGAGDRLGLLDETTGECLPAVMLPYCGRTMMEVLLRDLQAREYLYFKLTGQQLVTPVAIMTSEAKGNDFRLHQLMESHRWFGRGKDAFRLFRQPLVPVMNVENGQWLLSDQLHPMTKPGGHGAIWKLLRDEGVFSWLQSQGREAAIIRQISNPMAGLDTTLLALAGVGVSRGAAFGFMSCDRHVGAAEGVNVLQENKVWKDGRWQYEYGITNIEYTEFDRLGITDHPVEGAPGSARLSAYPANTNVLYVGLKAAHDVVEKAIATGSSDRLMPGLIFNLKKKVAYKDPLLQENSCGVEEQKVQAGRMECTMQNLADYMVESFDTQMSPAEAAAEKLSTFLVYNHRRKVTSSAKKKREPGTTKISQTPDGSFFDLQRNAWHLLQQCGVKSLPELGSVEQYLAQGPGFIFLYHPALGPLWDVISQKVTGGSLHQGSELVLEVAEARLEEVHVEGSLLVYAENVIGHKTGPITVHGLQYGEEGVQLHAGLPNQLALRQVSAHVPLMKSLKEEGMRSSPAGFGEAPSCTAAGVSAAEERLQYSSKCGKVHLDNVAIRNLGVDWMAPGNVYWKHHVKRREAVRIVLQGRSEFEARDVVISGDHTFTVPDGYRMVVNQGSSGGLVTQLSSLSKNEHSWQWQYTMDNDGSIKLDQKWAIPV